MGVKAEAGLRTDAKSLFEKAVEDLKRDSNSGRATTRADVTKIGKFAMEARFGDNKFIIDEAPPWGDGSGPSPLQTFLAAYGACQEVIFTKHAAKLGIPFDSIRMTVVGRFDRRGIYGVGEIDPSFYEVEAIMSVESSAGEGQIKRIAAETDKHCPVHLMVSKAVPVIKKQLILNGKTISATG